MNKIYLALCAAVLALLGGCATSGGDVVGTSVSVGYSTAAPFERLRIDD